MSVLWQNGASGALAASVTQACTFAATLPLAAGGSTMRVARAGLALALVPILLAAHESRPAAPLFEAVASGALIGAAFGLSASVVCGAVSAAGSLIDSSLMWAPFADRAGTGGALAYLYQVAFILVLLQTGGFNAIVNIFARATLQLPLHIATLSGILSLGEAALKESLVLAAPALLAQTLASLLAGILARAAPQVNGMLVSAPIICAAVGLALVAGGSALFISLVEVVRELLAMLAQA